MSHVEICVTSNRLLLLPNFKLCLATQFLTFQHEKGHGNFDCMVFFMIKEKKGKKKGRFCIYFYSGQFFQTRMVSFYCSFGFYYYFPLPSSHSEGLLLKTMFCLKMTIFIKVAEEGEEQPLAAALSGWGLGPQTLLAHKQLEISKQPHQKFS